MARCEWYHHDEVDALDSQDENVVVAACGGDGESTSWVAVEIVDCVYVHACCAFRVVCLFFVVSCFLWRFLFEGRGAAVGQQVGLFVALFGGLLVFAALVEMAV